MAQTKKQPKRSVTMWLDGPDVAWLDARAAQMAGRGGTPNRTEAAREALDLGRSLSELLGEELHRVRALASLEVRPGTPGEALGAMLAKLVEEALEKRSGR